MDWDCSTQAVQYFLVHGQIGPSDTKIPPWAEVQEDASVNPCQTPLSSRAVTTCQNCPDRMHNYLALSTLIQSIWSRWTSEQRNLPQAQ